MGPPPPEIDRDLVAGGLLETLPTGQAVLAFDLALRFVAVYGDSLRRAGWADDAILGRSASELLAGDDDAAELLSAYRRALSGGRSRLRLNRETRAWHVEVASLRDRRGRIVGGLVVGQDISAAQQARRLHDARARAAALIASAGEDLPVRLVREVTPLLSSTAAAYWQADADGRL